MPLLPGFALPVLAGPFGCSPLLFRERAMTFGESAISWDWPWEKATLKTEISASMMSPTKIAMDLFICSLPPENILDFGSRGVAREQRRETITCKNRYIKSFLRAVTFQLRGARHRRIIWGKRSDA